MKRLALECGGKSPAPRVLRLRRPRRRGAGRRLGRLLQPGRGLQRRLAAPRARRHQGRASSSESCRSPRRSGPATRSIPKTKMGAIVDDRQLERVLGYVETGKAEGAGLLLGGEQALAETGGYFVEPTVFDGVVERHDDRARGDLRAGAVDDLLHATRPRRSRSPTTRSTAWRPRSGPTTSTAPTAPRARSAPASSGSTASTRGDITLALRRLQAVGLRARQVDPRARQVHRPEVDLDPAEGGAMSVSVETTDERLLDRRRVARGASGARFEVTEPGRRGRRSAASADARPYGRRGGDRRRRGGARRLARADRRSSGRRLLRRAAELMRERKDGIAAVDDRRAGQAARRGGRRGRVRRRASSSGSPARPSGSTARSCPPQNPANRVLVLRQPVGVTAAITPWNFPAAMMTRKLGPALAAGCTSVVKPASATPLTARAIVRARSRTRARRRASSTSSPSRSPGWSPTTLFGDPRVRKLSFTGSTEVGKELIRASAGAGQAALARARRPRALHRLRRRRRSRRRSTA